MQVSPWEPSPALGLGARRKHVCNNAGENTTPGHHWPKVFDMTGGLGLRLPFTSITTTAYPSFVEASFPLHDVLIRQTFNPAIRLAYSP
jgi:hypothetical protein